MTTTQAAAGRDLRRLAKLYGVQTTYTDVLEHRKRRASVDALLAVLRALGARLASPQDAAAALWARQQQLWQRVVEPVVVAWQGGAEIKLRLPAALSDTAADCHLRLETGETREWKWQLASLPSEHTGEVEGERYQVKSARLPDKLPYGYHRLTLAVKGRRLETLILSAPRKAHLPRSGLTTKTWGVFLPLHALGSQQSWGTGDFSDLASLMEWVSSQGGGVVATLPFLAAFLDEPFSPSPYSPASRLFWNELFLGVQEIPELAHSPAAKEAMSSADFAQELEDVRADPLVDYRRSMALKRRVLEHLARVLKQQGSERLNEFRNFVETHPMLQDYARFRSVGERQHGPWQVWPQALREGKIGPDDYAEEDRDYHLYVQWVAHQQLQRFAEQARRSGPGLYLDLPLGVHPSSYDVWRERDIFAAGVSGGAPPDDFFVKGQDWGFPPLHPEKARNQGHRYFIACVRHHLRYAGILRIDHIMGLHRLLWVPHGMKATDGVYVHYPAEELYAILALESQRHQALIVGEDLGTVPRTVRPMMKRHGVHQTYIAQTELTSEPTRALPPPAPLSLAGLNTHDMATFAGFWHCLDIADRIELGLLNQAQAQEERARRARLKQALVAFLERTGWLRGSSAEPEVVVRACVAFLGASASAVTVVNLEDLWGEQKPQNVPGTVDLRPNWRRKAQYSLEEFRRMPEVVDPLRELNSQRRSLANAIQAPGSDSSEPD